jgi:hypothetical protein
VSSLMFTRMRGCSAPVCSTMPSVAVIHDEEPVDGALVEERPLVLAVAARLNEGT